MESEVESPEKEILKSPPFPEKSTSPFSPCTKSLPSPAPLVSPKMTNCLNCEELMTPWSVWEHSYFRRQLAWLCCCWPKNSEMPCMCLFGTRDLSGAVWVCVPILCSDSSWSELYLMSWAAFPLCGFLGPRGPLRTPSFARSFVRPFARAKNLDHI